MAYPTNPIYKLIKPVDSFNENGEPLTEPNSVEKMDGSYRICIPFNEDNRYYQEYLSWGADGNTAEAAD